MTPKETAIDTVETFSKLLGSKTRFFYSSKECNFVSVRMYGYQDRYSIFATAFEDKPDLIDVDVYDFADKTKRAYILDVSKIGPELAAKFTQEAINAYEQELAE